MKNLLFNTVNSILLLLFFFCCLLLKYIFWGKDKINEFWENFGVRAIELTSSEIREALTIVAVKIQSSEVIVSKKIKFVMFRGNNNWFKYLGVVGKKKEKTEKKIKIKIKIKK